MVLRPVTGEAFLVDMLAMIMILFELSAGCMGSGRKRRR